MVGEGGAGHARAPPHTRHLTPSLSTIIIINSLLVGRRADGPERAGQGGRARSGQGGAHRDGRQDGGRRGRPLRVGGLQGFAVCVRWKECVRGRGGEAVRAWACVACPPLKKGRGFDDERGERECPLPFSLHQ